MRTLCLFMLVLCWIPESDGAALSDNVLAGIVSQFRQVSGGGQFAFLMVLTPEQCTGTNINQNVEFIPSNSGEPVITGNPNDFLKNPLVNYIAVYPNTACRCSESKLLHLAQEDRDHGRHDSAAQRLQNAINNRPSDNRLQVGCVIIYTTYTPCIRSCFSNLENCEILRPLLRLPYSHTWASIDIQKYFVFSQIYQEDNNDDWIQVVQHKLRQIGHSAYNIKRCDETNNQMQCQDCTHPGYCIQ